jgi:hypothetical protein
MMSTSDGAVSLYELARLAVGEDPTRIKQAVGRYRAYEQEGLIQLERAPAVVPLFIAAKFRTGKSAQGDWLTARRESDSHIGPEGLLKQAETPKPKAASPAPTLKISPAEAAKIAAFEEPAGRWSAAAWEFCGGRPEVDDWVPRKQLLGDPSRYGLVEKYQGRTENGAALGPLLANNKKNGLSVAVNDRRGVSPSRIKAWLAAEGYTPAPPETASAKPTGRVHVCK